MSWKGWYEQNGARSKMVIGKFKVKDNKISGEGQDEVGKFVFAGLYDTANEVHFIKRYLGQHEVHYKGKREGQTISGTWSVMGMSGTFYLYKEREWSGHYKQGGNANQMKIDSLKFRQGKITGRGEDGNGKFVINGDI